jgi:hypothetical protein
VALAGQPDNEQLDLFFVGDDESIHMAWAIDNNAWVPPGSISAAKLAPAGAPIEAGWHPPDEQLDAFVVGHDGAVWMTYERENSAWQPPTPITPPGLAPAGSHLAVSIQPPNQQIDVFVVGNDGAVHLLWAMDNGPWQGPLAITPAAFAKPGSALAASVRTPVPQLDVFAIGNDDQIHVIYSHDTGPWQGPDPITGPVVAKDSNLEAIVFAHPDVRVYAVTKNNRFVEAKSDGRGPWTHTEIL